MEYGYFSKCIKNYSSGVIGGGSTVIQNLKVVTMDEASLRDGNSASILVGLSHVDTILIINV